MGKYQKSFYSLAKNVSYEILMEGQIASSGAHQARLIEKFKKNKNYIKHQFLGLKIVFSFLFVVLPILPLMTFFQVSSQLESGVYTVNAISFISSFIFAIFFAMTFLYLLMFGMITTSSFMSGNSFKWLQTLPFSKKDLKKIGFMTIFRNLDIPLIILIAAFPVVMIVATQNIFIFLASILLSLLNVIFSFSVLVIIGEKLSSIFSESKGKSKRVNLVRIIYMIGYVVIMFGSGLILTWGINIVEGLFDLFTTREPTLLVNIIFSLIPIAFAPAYFMSLSIIPTQFPLELIISTLIGLVLFILVTWVLFRVAQRALQSTISTEIQVEQIETKKINIEINSTSTIMAYIRKDLVSATRDLQSFMFIFFPIFYPLILAITMQVPLSLLSTSIEGLLLLWSIVLAVYLFIPPMLTAGLLNLEESGSSTVASLPVIPRQQAKAKLILMLTIQGISLTLISIVLAIVTNSPIVFLLFLVTLPIAWSLLLLMFEIKIHLFGKMKYKYILEELNKEHKISKWILMILSEIGLFLLVLIVGSIVFIIFDFATAILLLLLIGVAGLSILIFSFTRMFPKLKKIADYKTGGFLREHVNISTLVIIILYALMLYFVAIPILLLIIPTLNSLLGILFVNFLVVFGVLGVLLLIIIPRGLKLPKKENFRNFIKTIGLSEIRPIWRNLLIGLGSVAVYGLSVILFGSLLGTFVFDLNTLFRPPSYYTFGWFAFIFMLRPGIWEEVTFRGVILNLQLKRYSNETSMVLNGVIFGLFHFINLIEVPNIYITSIQVIFACCIGIALANMYIKTGSLIPCIITHYLINALGAFLLNISFSSLTFTTLFYLIGMSIVPMILIIILVNLVAKKRPKRLIETRQIL
ncbi:MAG: type II CAAX prenyl endopeptidase Rce1 family protein [Candidatus Thorarchaeota archaeon]